MGGFFMKTVFVIVDVQHKILSVMSEPEATTNALVKLTTGMQLLDVPTILLEQYPQGLGPTDANVQAAIPHVTPIAKTSFSAYSDEQFKQALNAIEGLERVVLCGIESHICMYQTARDLLAAGYTVEIVADAVDARTADNKQIGLDRMVQEGALITSIEMILFELLGHAKHPQFKAISQLIK